MRVAVTWFCAALLRNFLCPGKTHHIIKIPFSSFSILYEPCYSEIIYVISLSLKSLLQFFLIDAFVSPLIRLSWRAFRAYILWFHMVLETSLSFICCKSSPSLRCPGWGQGTKQPWLEWWWPDGLTWWYMFHRPNCLADVNARWCPWTWRLCGLQGHIQPL